MKNKLKFLMGVGLSASASYVWTLVPNSSTFAVPSNPLAFFEHYHWGLASMIVAKKLKRAKPYKPYLYGFGAGMVVIEGASSQPFGIGKPPEQFIPATVIGIAELAYLLI